MSDAKNVKVILKSRPVGTPKPSDFEVVEAPIPKPGAGEMLCRTIYLSLDPYMRGRISGVQSYARGVEIGEVIVGGTVSQVGRRHLRHRRPDVRGPGRPPEGRRAAVGVGGAGAAHARETLTI